MLQSYRLQILCTLLIGLLGAGCNALFDTGGEVVYEDVQLRVINNSDYVYEDVQVNGVAFGNLAPGQASDYVEMEQALYHYGFVTLEVKGERFVIQPIDYVGETPLGPGRYTYLLSADVETNLLWLHFFEGDERPTGGQRAGRSRVVEVTRQYEALDGAEASGGGAFVAGRRITRRLINPTVSDVPGSPVAYFPDARVVAVEWEGSLVRLNASGAQLWERTYGEGAPHDRGFSAVQPLPDGGALLAGALLVGDPYQQGGPGLHYDVWLVRTDAQGQELWSRHLGGEKDQEAVALRATADGGFVVAGMHQYLAWLLKLTADGQEEWSRQTNLENYAETVVQTTDGGYAFAGDRFGNAKNWKAGWLVRTDALGQERWRQVFDGSALAVAETTDGGFVLAGGRHTPDQSFQALLFKLDADGEPVWEHLYGGPSKEFVLDMTATADGGFAIGGAGSGNGRDFWLVKTDAEGREMWSRTYDRAGTDDELRAVRQTGDGGFLLFGMSDRAAWVVRTDAQGNLLWEHEVSGT